MSATLSEADPPTTFFPSSLSHEADDEKPRSGQKRGRDSASDDDGGDENEPKRRAETVPKEVIFRIVVPPTQIGRVIGAGGGQIQRIREETRAAIKIADAVTPHEERVIIINSRVEDSVVSDAENALHYIASIILEGDDMSGGTKYGTGHLATKTIRVLIAGSQAGCLIGKSGQKIEQIRNSSGATITVMSQDQLPSCASAHKSDRLVQVSGDIPNVLEALKRIGDVLRDNPPKKVISIRPNDGFTAPISAPSHLTVPSADHVTSEMFVLEKLVGGLIGRGGHNISKIRSESGATIKVAGSKGSGQQRQIYFSGSSEQVALAQMLVERYICSQLLQSGSLC
ncbi:KH domain-containing protein [Acorus calamus]|uniref:KH domain-containing protein n=1 Tax=Acorus calamus TaxID=4465 RepID=A0AAV9C9Z0_ACOCL|nr:KH domain-containing protein [Acorus calamus]